MADMHLVFVYGSLKDGFHNNRILVQSHLVKADAVTVEARFTMRSLIRYPAVLEGGTHRVRGEVYEVDPETLKTLDALEGNGFVYQRKLIHVEGLKRKVWMYIWLDPDVGFYEDELNPSITDGVAHWQVPADA